MQIFSFVYSMGNNSIFNSIFNHLRLIYLEKFQWCDVKQIKIQPYLSHLIGIQLNDHKEYIRNVM